MQNNNYKLINFRIMKIHCDVDPDSINSPISVSVENSISSYPHTDRSVKKGLLKVETSITSPDCEEFEIQFTSESIFSFDETPEDFHEAFHACCYPIAEDRICKAVRELSLIMGMNPLDIRPSDAE